MNTTVYEQTPAGSIDPYVRSWKYFDLFIVCPVVPPKPCPSSEEGKKLFSTISNNLAGEASPTTSLPLNNQLPGEREREDAVGKKLQLLTGSLVTVTPGPIKSTPKFIPRSRNNTTTYKPSPEPANLQTTFTNTSVSTAVAATTTTTTTTTPVALQKRGGARSDIPQPLHRHVDSAYNDALSKSSNLDQIRVQLEKDYSVVDTRSSSKDYSRYVSRLIEYKRKCSLIGWHGGGGGRNSNDNDDGVVDEDGFTVVNDRDDILKPTKASWRSFAWGDVESPLLSFELCMSSFCLAAYQYGVVKAWIKEHKSKLMIDLECLLYERVEDAYILSFSSDGISNGGGGGGGGGSGVNGAQPFNRRDRPKDRNFGYYSSYRERNLRGRLDDFRLNMGEIVQLKKRIDDLHNAASTFYHIAYNALPRSTEFVFPYTPAFLPGSDGDDAYVPNPAASAAAATATPSTLSRPGLLTTTTWSQEFVGVCDKVTCLKLYGYCSLLAAALTHVLLNDHYLTQSCSNSSGAKIDGSADDYAKSKALLQHAVYMENVAKRLPVRIPAWENRLSVFCLLCYARYAFDLEFRCRGTPPDSSGSPTPSSSSSSISSSSSLTLDGYKAHKTLAKVLVHLCDPQNVQNAYSLRRINYHTGSLPSFSLEQLPERLRSVMSSVDKYCYSLLSSPLSSFANVGGITSGHAPSTSSSWISSSGLIKSIISPNLEGEDTSSPHYPLSTSATTLLTSDIPLILGSYELPRDLDSLAKIATMAERAEDSIIQAEAKRMEEFEKNRENRQNRYKSPWPQVQTSSTNGTALSSLSLKSSVLQPEVMEDVAILVGLLSLLERGLPSDWLAKIETLGIISKETSSTIARVDPNLFYNTVLQPAACNVLCREKKK